MTHQGTLRPEPRESNAAAAVLERARDIIRTRGWTRNAIARDSTGMPVGPINFSACEWCLIGALQRAAYDLRAEGVDIPPWEVPLAFNAVRNATGVLLGGELAHWNDAPARTRDDVIDALDRAASLARRGAA